jgi:hypothetical protein
MKIEKVVDFRTFHKLNEADEATGVLSAADQIVDLFFQAYNGIVSKIGDYKDAVNDLTSVAKSEVEKKGEVMLETINKLADKVDPKYKDAANEMILAAKKIKEAYDVLIETEDGRKQLEKINDKIYAKIISQLNTLKSVVTTEIPKMENSSENLNFSESGSLFEKLFDRTFQDERGEIIKKITPIYSTLVELGKNSPSDELKKKCLELSKELKGYLDKLGSENEEYWKELKRGARKDEIKKINDSVNEIPDKMLQIQTQSLLKLGIDKKVKELITSAGDSIKTAMETLGKEEEKKIEASAEKKDEQAKEKSEEKGEGKKDGEKKEEIVSGTVDVNNLKKSGKNREAIKNIQRKMNMLLPKDQGIKDDGLYGNNTESAIKKISSLYSSISPEIKDLDGKKITPEFRRFLDNFEKNKDKIADLFK